MNKYSPSVFDRIFDDAPDSFNDNISSGLTAERIKACVARDIENLLNSRGINSAGYEEKYPNLMNSVFSFGMSDFSSASFESSLDRERICRAIGRAIEIHEVRLRDVSVSLQVAPNLRQAHRFSVSATLQLDPAALPVKFDALFQPLQYKYSVALSDR